MSTIQEYNESISGMKAELSATKKKFDSLNSMLKQKQSLLRKMVQSIEKKNDVIDRDIELCRKYIAKNPGCPSKNVIAYLNITLANNHKRWKYLDSNTFMGCMGIYLESSGMFTNEKTVVDGNYTNIWKLK